MSDRTSRLIVQLIDGVSGPARVAARSLVALKHAGQAAVALREGKVMAQNAKALGRNARRVGTEVATPLAVIGGFAAKTAFEFEKAGNFLEALGDATAEQRGEFEKTAKVLNAKYPQSLTEIIKTGTELLKAGLDWKQMLGAMEPTLQTAILGDMKPSEVAGMISAAINAFQMPKETMEQALQSTTTVADRMTYSAVKTTASLREMGDYFRYVAGAASATGSSIDDATAFAMAFSATKVNGSEAGVALRNAIVRLSKGGTKKGNEALERVGMPITNYQRGRQPVTAERIMSGLAAGGIDGSPFKARLEAMVNDPELKNSVTRLAAKVTAMLQEELPNMGSAMDATEIATNVQESIIAAGSKIDLMRFFTDLREKMAIGKLTEGDLNQILEGKHFSKYMALMQADLGKIKAHIESEAGGYAASRYGITLKGFVGPAYEASAALETLAASLGRAVGPEVANGLTAFSAKINGLAETSPGILKWSVAAAAAVAAVGALGLIGPAVMAGVGVVTSAISLIVGGLAAASGILAAVLGPIGLVIAAVVALGVAIYANREAIAGWIASFGSWLGDIGGKIGSAISGAASGLFAAGANMFQQLWEGMKSKLAAMLGWVSGVGAQIKGALGFGGGGGTAPAGPSPTARAGGGNVTRGRAYVVGEKRPELFFPGQSGTIHPNTNIGGRGGVSVTVAPVLNINGAQDAKEIASQVMRTIRNEIGEAFRGLQSDTGLTFA